MADVIGPNRYKPGQSLKAIPDMPCDDHPDRPSVVRIVGETDSFGSELIDFCEECYEKMKKEMEENNSKSGICDWCKEPAEDLIHHRDVDEGLHGRLYMVCGECRKKENADLLEELKQYQDSCDEYFDPSEDD